MLDNEVFPHKKKKKKTVRKSNHKHQYITAELPKKLWFTHIVVCVICGHITNEIRIGENHND